VQVAEEKTLSPIGGINNVLLHNHFPLWN
jgi:hypothetical protein